MIQVGTQPKVEPEDQARKEKEAFMKVKYMEFCKVHEGRIKQWLEAHKKDGAPPPIIWDEERQLYYWPSRAKRRGNAIGFGGKRAR